MKKQYTKKQIMEAISYWKNQLRRGNYKKLNEAFETGKFVFGLGTSDYGGGSDEGIILDSPEQVKAKGLQWLQNEFASWLETIKDANPADYVDAKSEFAKFNRSYLSKCIAKLLSDFQATGDAEYKLGPIDQADDAWLYLKSASPADVEAFG